MKKIKKEKRPNIEINYAVADVDPAEVERRLNAAYDILFDIVFKNENKPMKKAVSVLK